MKTVAYAIITVLILLAGPMWYALLPDTASSHRWPDSPLLADCLLPMENSRQSDTLEIKYECRDYSVTFHASFFGEQTPDSEAINDLSLEQLLALPVRIEHHRLKLGDGTAEVVSGRGAGNMEVDKWLWFVSNGTLTASRWRVKAVEVTRRLAGRSTNTAVFLMTVESSASLSEERMRAIALVFADWYSDE